MIFNRFRNSTTNLKLKYDILDESTHNTVNSISNTLTDFGFSKTFQTVSLFSTLLLPYALKEANFTFFKSDLPLLMLSSFSWYFSTLSLSRKNISSELDSINNLAKKTRFARLITGTSLITYSFLNSNELHVPLICELGASFFAGSLIHYLFDTSNTNGMTLLRKWYLKIKQFLKSPILSEDFCTLNSYPLNSK